MRTQYDRYELNTTTEKQVPALEQGVWTGHQKCDGIIHVCERSNIPLIWDSGVTLKHLIKC